MSGIKHKVAVGLKHPEILLLKMLKVIGPHLPDKPYLKLLFLFNMRQRLNLDYPKSFNEKLQWLKLNFRKPEMTIMVDKYRVRAYVAEKIGETYLVPLLGVWNRPEEIDIDALPNEFVLKCNHNSGVGNCVCKDKSRINFADVLKNLNVAFRQDYFLRGREWPYKDVRKCIIAEKLLVDHTTGEDSLRDYKFFCFEGKVRFFKIDLDRFTEHHANYYSPTGELLKFGEKDLPPLYGRKVKMPDTLSKMVELAEKLSKDFPFLRVDFYDVDGRIYFGELTFYPASGIRPFTSMDWDYKLGKWLKLPFEKDGK